MPWVNSKNLMEAKQNREKDKSSTEKRYRIKSTAEKIDKKTFYSKLCRTSLTAIFG